MGAFTDWKCTKCGNIFKKAGKVTPSGSTPNKCSKNLPSHKHIWVLIKQR